MIEPAPHWKKPGMLPGFFMSAPCKEVASFAAGVMGNPVAVDISNQANPEKQS
ncbi:MAG: hypothetical protein HY848_20745 [Betaproteobacteria bacterium]|nr:hypothetical protein [Betaproteobacteria bacterium]